MPKKIKTSPGKLSDLDLGERGRPVYTFGCAWMTHAKTACWKLHVGRCDYCHVIAQAISRWLLTAVARVRNQAIPCTFSLNYYFTMVWHLRRLVLLYLLNDLYSSPNIFRVIKSRRMRWAGNVACMRERRGLYRILVGKPVGKPQA